MLRNAVSRTTLKAVGQSGSSSGSSDSYHPNLGLHSAAASGNIGLVKFALENGQPANSNFNGILPLHAACSGGSEQTVRMLVLHGADVNSPRLKSKGSTGGPGAEGSTPLHFAAANGHLEIVRMLLEAGARPAAADKDGVVPEALALGNGHQQCAQLIRSWISAYGSNGLAGMVSSRDTVSGDVNLGPAGHIRYAAAGSASSGSNGMASSSSTSANNTSASSQTSRKASSSAASGSGSLRPRRSYEALPSNSKPTSLRSAAAFKKPSITKISSNPNLRGEAEAASASTSTPALPTSTSPAPAPAPAPASAAEHAPSSTVQQFPVSSSPKSSFNSLSRPTYVQESPAALEPEEEAELAFASSVNPPAGMPNASSSSALRESKRRPSLPSILEKAAHPAASIRAALGNNNHTHAGPNSAINSGADSHDLGSLSPGKKANRLGGKRSLSNMLRKATGSSHIPSTSSSTSVNTIASSQGGGSNDMASNSINLSTLTKPGRVPGKSFDYQRPMGRRNTGGELSSEDSDPRQPVTAPSSQTTFSTPRLPSSTSDANASERKQRLRTASSSSSLSSQLPTFDSVEKPARTRSSSNEQIPLGRATVGQSGSRGKASLDLSRSGYGMSNNGETALTAASGSTVGASNSTWLAVQANRKRANSSWSGDHGSVSELASSDAGSISHGVGGEGEGYRARSASASSSLGVRGMAGRGRIASSSSQDEPTDVDADDAQEFLVHTDPISPTDDAGEHHDVHHLPEGLRNLTALRQQSSTSDLHSSARSVTTPGSGMSSADAPYGSSTTRQTRNRSGSSLSAISSGSHSSHRHASGHGASDSGARSSPNLSGAYQALSIAEENGLEPSPGTPSSQFGRAGSVADSLGSRASTSSLRSNYLSAAEQAQAILNQEGPFTSDGPDGTSMSLAAQLAAYGEALAQERKRAGEARTGPSPSLSARGSNAALRSKLPSVSEDQSPSKPLVSAAAAAAATGSTGARAGSVGERRTPNYPATAAQSYNRRVSRRPHSSEGRESRDSSLQRSGQLGAPSSGEVGRAKTITTPVSSTHASLRNLFLEAPRVPGSGLDRSVSPSLTTPGFGSPLHGQIQSSWKTSGTGSDHGTATPLPLAPTASASTLRGLRAGDMQRSPSEDLLRQKRQGPPAVPAKDPARSNAPTVLRGTPSSISAPTVFEDDPTTPVMSGNQHGGFDVYATSPRSVHRYSPSMPTELSSYATARQERSPSATLSGSHTSLTPPIPPPRKESMNAPDFGASPYSFMTANSSASGSGFLNPDSAASMGLPSSGATFRGRFLSAEEGSTSSGRREGLRRPSLSMLRGASSSSSSAHSHSTISHEAVGAYLGGGDDGMSTAEPGNTGSSASGGKPRRLVRNLLSNIKGTSS